MAESRFTSPSRLIPDAAQRAALEARLQGMDQPLDAAAAATGHMPEQPSQLDAGAAGEDGSDPAPVAEGVAAQDAACTACGVESALAGTFGDVAGAGDVALVAVEGLVAQGALLADTFHVAGPDREAAADTAIALWASTRESAFGRDPATTGGPAPGPGAPATAASSSSSSIRSHPGAMVTAAAGPAVAATADLRHRTPEPPVDSSGAAAAAPSATSSSCGGGGRPALAYSEAQFMAVVWARDEAVRNERECKAAQSDTACNLAMLLRDVALQQAATCRRNVAEQQRRLGNRVAVRVTATHTGERWEDGEDFIQLAAKEERLKAEKLALEHRLKEVRKRNKRKRGEEVGGSVAGGSATRGRGGAGGGAAARGAALPHSSDDDEDAGEPRIDGAAAPGAGGPGAMPLSGPGAMPMQPAVPRHGAAGGSLDGVQRELELVEQEETLKYAQAALKRDEGKLADRRRALELEKAALQLEMERLLNESRSRFRGNVVLPGERFMLMELLGKGGCGEVWRAVDLHSATEVAVKIHQLAAHWPEDTKAIFVKHAVREYEIQRSLVHPHIVGLVDVVEIDADSFATVLEYCPGGDLDRLLKQQYAGSYMAERDARAIIIQLLTALRYLNGHTSQFDAGGAVPAAAASGSGMGAGAAASSSSSSAAAASGGGAMPPPLNNRRIIHYDIKPANILFDAGRGVKLADFGLSKILEDKGDGGSGSSLELTSQGAGTYWYLPPEVFAEGGQVRISNKVDVWSVGVIFYQMLYGRRPFGEGMGQEEMRQQGTIVDEARRGPQFPPGPRLSDGAKAFILRCLTFSQAARPDIFSICEDPYLRQLLR